MDGNVGLRIEIYLSKFRRWIEIDIGTACALVLYYFHRNMKKTNTENIVQPFLITITMISPIIIIRVRFSYLYNDYKQGSYTIFIYCINFDCNNWTETEKQSQPSLNVMIVCMLLLLAADIIDRVQVGNQFGRWKTERKIVVC